MNWIKMHWAWIGGLLGVVIPFEKPSIDAYIAAHPHAILAVLLGAAVAAYYKQSPLSKSTPAPK